MGLNALLLPVKYRKIQGNFIQKRIAQRSETQNVAGKILAHAQKQREVDRIQPEGRARSARSIEITQLQH
jgi:hypothetical protein